MPARVMDCTKVLIGWSTLSLKIAKPLLDSCVFENLRNRQSRFYLCSLGVFKTMNISTYFLT